MKNYFKKATENGDLTLKKKSHNKKVSLWNNKHKL